MGYVWDQLLRALDTARNHDDETTRKRAAHRVAEWQQLMKAVKAGTVTIGSRTPLKNYPGWVTPRVIRGGFATGKAVAAGPLSDAEKLRAQHLNIPATRQALFASHLSDEGITELLRILDSGDYSVAVPESAALLVVAALIRAGHTDEVAELLAEITPYADRLKFSPGPGTPSGLKPGQVYRYNAGQVATALTTMTPQRQVEAQREALTVWLPLVDRARDFWVERQNQLTFNAQDIAAARDLVAAYDQALKKAPYCRKYRSEKENLPILISCARIVATDWRAGRWPSSRVSHVLSCLKPPADGLRQEQSRIAALPSYAEIGQVAADRVGKQRSTEGFAEVDPLLSPITAAEARGRVVAGTPLPDSVQRRIRLGQAGTLPELAALGLVPSAEALAGLLPQLTALEVARPYRDPALGRLMAATYKAFRRRRTLLLAGLQSQIRFDELPWVRAAQANAVGSICADAGELALRVATMALELFPGTILPNVLIRELWQQFRAAGIQVVLTEEIAADIFEGRFKPHFVAAAQQAAQLLRGSVYEAYFGLDYEAVDRLQKEDTAGFARLCAVPASGQVVVDNGRMIERQQLWTTHNLAALAERVRPEGGWLPLAEGALAKCGELLAAAKDRKRAKAAIKDAAYAWRQAVFFVAMTESPQGAIQHLAELPVAAVDPLRSLVADLGRAATGQRVEPFTGWVAGRHWILDLAE